MDVEQVVRTLIDAFNAHDLDRAFSYLADDFTVSGFGPEPRGRKAAVAQMRHQIGAIPDWKFTIEEVTINGNEVTVDVTITGTHTQSLAVGVPGTGTIAPTGRKFAFPDKLTYTVRGDKISSLRIESPANGGPMEMLRQLGVQMSPR